jgi:hypothetical protein
MHLAEIIAEPPKEEVTKTDVDKSDSVGVQCDRLKQFNSSIDTQQAIVDAEISNTERVFDADEWKIIKRNIISMRMSFLRACKRHSIQLNT